MSETMLWGSVSGNTNNPTSRERKLVGVKPSLLGAWDGLTWAAYGPRRAKTPIEIITLENVLGVIVWVTCRRVPLFGYVQLCWHGFARVFKVAQVSLRVPH